MATKENTANASQLSCAEAMEKLIGEMGDPDEFVNAADLIVLKLFEPLPVSCRVPSPLALDTDRLRLTTDPRGIVTCQDFLIKHRYTMALFAGLPNLRSIPSFIAAAPYMLRNLETLIVVHNRDWVVNLAGIFGVLVLVLYHDLHLQVDPRKRELCDIDVDLPLLEKVYGSTPGLGCDQLYFDRNALIYLVATAWSLMSVQAPMDHVLAVANKLEREIPILRDKTSLLHSLEELTLGSHAWRHDGEPALLTEPCGLKGINEAIKRYPHLQRLQVTTRSRDVVSCIAQFSLLTRLAVAYVDTGPPCPFEPHATGLLLSSLTHLTLISFEGVRLPIIDKSCPNLQSLDLRGTRVHEDNVGPTAFRNLSSLSVDAGVFIRSFRTLLRAARGLSDLCITGTGICAAFLSGPPYVTNRPYKCLRRLTLRTDQRLSQLCRGPEDLHALFKRLPALERLSTDSYDIRLFVQHYHPRVKLTWTSCTVCIAEFPKQPGQEEVWRIVHGAK